MGERYRHPNVLAVHFTLAENRKLRLQIFSFREIQLIQLFPTRAVLAVVLVELDENGGGNHQEISQRGCGRVSHHRKPLAQAAQALRHSKRQFTKMTQG